MNSKKGASLLNCNRIRDERTGLVCVQVRGKTKLKKESPNEAMADRNKANSATHKQLRRCDRRRRRCCRPQQQHV